MRLLKRGVVAAALAAMLAAAPSAAQAPSDFSTWYRYDSDGRQTGTIAPDPDGAGPLGFAAVRKSYDGGGRLVKVEQGQLAVWQSEAVVPAAWTGFTILQVLDTEYDAMDRKTRELASGGGATASVVEYGYDIESRLKCTAVRMNPDAWATPLPDKCVPGPAHATYGQDRISKSVYDPAGQVVEAWNGVGTPLQRREAAYQYDPDGRKKSLTDARGYRAEMTYDGHGRQQRWIFPSKTTAGVADPNDYEEYGYDSGGNRTTLRKRDGGVLVYTYDALNRMVIKQTPGHVADVRYDYDLRGLQTLAFFTLNDWSVGHSYDGFGRMVSTTTNMGGFSRTVSRQHDRDGQEVELTFPDGQKFWTARDGLGRATEGYQGHLGSTAHIMTAFADGPGMSTAPPCRAPPRARRPSPCPRPSG